MRECINCHQQSNGNYCPDCGQIMESERITFARLLSEAINTFTHFDKGFLYTLKELAVRPGRMQKEYLLGRRTKHQKPFSMFFLCATIAAFVLYVIHKPSGTAITHFTEMQGHFMRHYYVLVQLALLPFYAFVTWILFRNNNMNYAESLVLFTYTLAFLLLLVMFTNLVNLISGTIPSGYYEIPVLFGYLFWTNYKFFSGEPPWRILLKSLFSILICYFIFKFLSNFVVQQLM